MEKKKYTQLFLLKHCRLTMFSWASVSILDFLNQQEKFTISVTCFTKLTLVAEAAFIRKIHCFEVFKILFGQLVDRMLKNKSLHESEAPIRYFAFVSHGSRWGLYS